VFLIALGRGGEKLIPRFTRCCGVVGYWGDLGDQIAALVGSQLTRAQIDGPIVAAE